MSGLFSRAARAARGGDIRPGYPKDDSVKVILSPGAVACRCGWSAESYSAEDLFRGYLNHPHTEGVSE